MITKFSGFVSYIFFEGISVQLVLKGEEKTLNGIHICTPLWSQEQKITFRAWHFYRITILKERLDLQIFSMYSLDKVCKKLFSQLFFMPFTKPFMQEEFATNDILISPPNYSFFLLQSVLERVLLICYTKPWLLLIILQHMGSSHVQNAPP